MGSISVFLDITFDLMLYPRQSRNISFYELLLHVFMPHFKVFFYQTSDLFLDFEVVYRKKSVICPCHLQKVIV